MVLRILFTGKKASGKGNLVKALASQGFRTVSFGDICRKKAETMFGRDYNASQLQDAGDSLRKERGPGALAEILLEQPEIWNSNLVVDGIRNPAEIRELRKSGKVYVVAVDAPRRERYRRLKARGRPGDPKTYKKFIELDNRDLRDEKNPDGQQVLNCIFMSDYHFFSDFPTQEQAAAEFLSGNSGLMNLIGVAKPRRPSFDEIFMRQAYEMARRSTCLRRIVGAVITLDDRSIATGYNGPPIGFDHCEETGCAREKLGVPSGQRAEICRAVHAEENAVLQLVRNGGPSPVGGTMYSTTYPCTICAKTIVNALTPRKRDSSMQPRLVVWAAYTDDYAEKILDDHRSKIKVQGYTGISPEAYPKFFG